MKIPLPQTTTTVFLLLGGIVSLANSLQQQQQCNSLEEQQWSMPLVRVGSRQYYLGVFFKANWYKALQFCRFHSLQLLSIESLDENKQIEKLVNQMGHGADHFWTSGSDLGEEDNFVWMGSGRPVGFTNWNAGEPNNFKYENGEEEHCLELWNRDAKGLMWNDTPCSFKAFFICEREN